MRDALSGHDEPYGLVMPHPDALIDDGQRVPVGISNKIVYLAPLNTGAAVAEDAVEEAHREWSSLVEGTHGSTPPTPGMPDLAWVSVAGEISGDAYRELWSAAARALDQRKRTRWFEVSRTTSRALCAQSPLLPSVPVPRGPGAMSVPKHERREKLSAAGWVKRHVGNTLYGPGNRFPATTVIASSWFRDQLIRRAEESPELRGELVPLVRRLLELAPPDGVKHAGLPTTVPPDLEALSTSLGTLISPDAWEPRVLREEYGDNAHEPASAGRKLASRIGKLAREHGVPKMTPYFAIVVQDLDRLGKKLGDLGLADQRAASRALTKLGSAQRELSAATEYLGVPVFAGGDDFLAFAPARTALSLAAAVRALTHAHLQNTPALREVTASTAVVFSHMTSPLREAIATAQRALDQTKDAEGAAGEQRNALGVVVLRRGGERARTVQPWYPGEGQNTAELLDAIAPDADFSGRLASHLERDHDELNRLAAHSRAEVRETAHAEVRRLVTRQGGSDAVADAVIKLGEQERRAPGEAPRFDPVPSTLVARFLAQECR
ncbi:hypothetical protein ABT324_09610 [Saccharopolyspora sp. NPDC000359]|uniref:Cas10/Cmr2 second palm domain-containing protein n=1 Tax=Saccharopolyspora sp. NPDC000359 TaxID=3154251 RepID=UPI003318DD23